MVRRAQPESVRTSSFFDVCLGEFTLKIFPQFWPIHDRTRLRLQAPQARFGWWGLGWPLGLELRDDVVCCSCARCMNIHSYGWSRQLGNEAGR